MRLSIACLTLLSVLSIAPGAVAQTNMQLWGNLTFDRITSERVTYEFDVEGKVLVAAPPDEPGWWNIDVTPTIEYVARPWLDLIGEVLTGFTHQTDDTNSTELTPRAGVRVHLFSRELPRRVRFHERPPTRRVVLRDRMLTESRNIFYSDSDTDSTVRFRNRLEFLVTLNRDKLTDDGARYLLADWEWFVPLDDPTERFANRQRIRSGVGFRRDAGWRYELLYIWSRSRDTTDENFQTSDHIIDVRVKRVF